MKFILQYWKFSFSSEICSYNTKHMSITSQTNKCCCTSVLWIKEKYTFQCTRKIKCNRKEDNSVVHLMKGKLAKCLVYTFNTYIYTLQSFSQDHLYMSDCRSQFKVDSERQFFEKLFHDNFIFNFGVFGRNLLRECRWRNIFSYFVLLEMSDADSLLKTQQTIY